MLRLTIADPVAGVRYSLQDQKSVPVATVTAGDGPLSLDAPARLQPDGRLTGPFVRREGAARRFVYIAIGKQAGDADSCWDRRAKIDVHDIPLALLRPDARLEAILPGRAKDGGPACASLRLAHEWRAI